MIYYGYKEKQEEKNKQNSKKKSIVMEFSPKSYVSPSICVACKNPRGRRKMYKVFDLSVCEICANKIRLKILQDN